MTKTRMALATIVSFLFGTILLVSGPGYLPSRNYTGVITDSMCGVDHAKMQITPDKECVQACVRNGAKYALLAGRNVYILSDQMSASKFAAQTVTVNGNLNKTKNTLTVLSIHSGK